MTEIRNEFSWSKSRDEVFRTCPRQYYFNYYGYWGGWLAAAPQRTGQIYMLKNLKNRFMWTGDTVHQCIKHTLKNLQRGISILSEEQIIAITIDRMREEFRSSREKRYRTHPKTCALFEHEYGADRIMNQNDTPPTQANPVIEAKAVYKSFKTVQAVKGVDLRIDDGQFVALLGPNGAGKTTLVEMIEGIQKPDSGQIRIMGKKWKGNEEALHRIIGLSLQETHFIKKLTVWETLQLFSSFYQLERQRVAEIIATVGLEEKQKSYVNNLSGGQRQRLALGIALLNRPKILLLDEPTTGLDPNARREIWSILLNLKERSQTSLILTTHYMEEAEHLCDYIIIIDQGRILTEGTLKELLDDDQGEKIIEFTLEQPSSAANVLNAHSSFQIRWDHGKGKGFVALAHLESELPEFFKYLKLKNLRLKNMECRRKTLDDLFTSMTGRRLHD